MFLNIDRWQEIFATLRANKLRTFLTSLAVAWGIFMLVVLLGAGGGLQAWAASNFKDDATNALWVFGGRTSKPFRGHNPNRRIRLTNTDYDRVSAYPESQQTASRFYPQGNVPVVYRDKASNFDIRATHPGHRYLENTIMEKGRFLNHNDIAERTKVAVIGIDVAKFLFGKKDPMGEFISIKGVAFRVVGLFSDDGADDEQQIVYIPISTAQRAFGGQDSIRQVMFLVDPKTTLEESQILEAKVRSEFSSRHFFDPKDRRALRIRNNVENFERFNSMFILINGFVWVIGIGTMIAGVIGVSNIMLISVQERTREIGVRKALGATPSSITALIVQEAVLVTGVAGFSGLCAAVGLLELARSLGGGDDFFDSFVVDFRVALYSTLILMAAGALAGFFPARRAASVPPVVALRAD